MEELVGAADEAMYAVKHGSKNGVHHFVAKGVPRAAPEATRRGATGVDSALPS